MQAELKRQEGSTEGEGVGERGWSGEGEGDKDDCEFRYPGEHSAEPVEREATPPTRRRVAPTVQ